MYKGFRIGVTIPAFNEERFIERTIENIPDFVDHISVIDDSSDDRTSLSVSKQADQRVSLIRHESNRGVGGSILTGYTELLKRGMDIVVVMAGDGQMDPDDLPSLLEPIVLGQADYTKGNRLYHRDVLRVMPKWKLFGNIALTLLTKISSGYPRVVDSQCGYTAARAATLKQLDFQQIYRRYGFPNDLLAHMNTASARVTDVIVRPIYRDEETGIKPAPAVFALSWVLVRSSIMRLKRKYQTSNV
jgi:glycosyltransferase involved in cell wall biosynthesis